MTPREALESFRRWFDTGPELERLRGADIELRMQLASERQYRKAMEDDLAALRRRYAELLERHQEARQWIEDAATVLGDSVSAGGMTITYNRHFIDRLVRSADRMLNRETGAAEPIDLGEVSGL